MTDELLNRSAKLLERRPSISFGENVAALYYLHPAASRLSLPRSLTTEGSVQALANIVQQHCNAIRGAYGDGGSTLNEHSSSGADPAPLTLRSLALQALQRQCTSGESQDHGQNTDKGDIESATDVATLMDSADVTVCNASLTLLASQLGRGDVTSPRALYDRFANAGSVEINPYGDVAERECFR